ncbi:hypothetical protein [Methylobacter sp.]|uniref:hypothetical protein n=1 Tax=Methylobacter sp. TaxID=2051955 RepID=UPI001221CF7B|nr:hypothetical protein [Methylobacter sp.]TAK62305.1 MAG: hypothetical protein EPO18_10905 [Methylobacter sp.]
MNNEHETRGAEWPYFDLYATKKIAKSRKKVTRSITKSRKKVTFVDQLRIDATLDSAWLAALLHRGNESAGFSIIDLIQSIPSNIQVSNYFLQDSRRQAQHYNKAPEWRNARHRLKAVFYQLAMLHQAEQSDCRLIPFTANLTPDFVNKALRHKKGFIDYTKRKIDRAMKSELSRVPQYWFVVELAPVTGNPIKGRQRPHLHGGILLTPPEKESVRKQKTPISRAFHRAIGKCHPDFSERLFVMDDHKTYAQQRGITEITAALNWPGYCLKYYSFTRWFLNRQPNLTADNATKRQAEALYGLLTPKSSPKLSTEDEAALEVFMNFNYEKQVSA